MNLTQPSRQRAHPFPAPIFHLPAQRSAIAPQTAVESRDAYDAGGRRGRSLLFGRQTEEDDAHAGSPASQHRDRYPHALCDLSGTIGSGAAAREVDGQRALENGLGFKVALLGGGIWATLLGDKICYWAEHKL